MSVTVEHAQLLIETPETRSSTELGITKADLQPSGSSIAGLNSMALTAAALTFSPSVVALDWTQDTLTIAVDTALITIQTYDVDGRRGTPVVTALPTLSGSIIDFQLSSGDWDLPVDIASPSILGQDLTLEKNNYFVNAQPTIAGQSIGLVKGLPVVTAALSFTGSDITLTPTTVLMLPVDVASLSFSPQTIGLEKTWSIAVDSTAFDVDGSVVVFDYLADDSVIVESAPFSVVGQSIVLTQSIPVTTTAISLSPQTITFRYDWGLPQTAAFPEIAGQEIGLSFSYTLGLVIEQGSFDIDGQEITMFLGDGQPTKARSTITSDHIQISFSKALSSVTGASEKIVG